MNTPRLLMLCAVVGSLAFMASASPEPAAASHRVPNRVYPVIFYGNNQTYDSAWPDIISRRLEQVRAWYKTATGGKTFTTGTVLTYQGTQNWQWYMNDDNDAAGAIFDDIRAQGEHNMYRFGATEPEIANYQGYVYIVYPAFAAPTVGWGVCSCVSGTRTAGHAMVSDVLWERDQRPNDCLPDWNCPYTQMLGADAHELGHAFIGDIDNPDYRCQGTPCLQNQGEFPNLSLLPNQYTQLNNHPLFSSNSGAIPNAPSGAYTYNFGNYFLIPCYIDNATNEQYNYGQFEQWNGDPPDPWRLREYQLYRSSAHSGTGDMCQSPGIAWFSQKTGETASYHMSVYAQGAGGNSAKVHVNNPWWYSAPMRFRPNAPTGVTAQPLSGGRLRVCWYDQSNGETGFLIKQVANFDPPYSGRTTGVYFVPAITAPAPSWNCKITEIRVSGSYHFEMFAVVQGASSSTSDPTKPWSQQPWPSMSGNVNGTYP